MLGEEKRIPLVDLGVYLIKHTDYVQAMPNIKFGESALAKIINYLPQYDAVESELTVDIRASRAKIIIPQFMAKGKNQRDLQGVLEDSMFVKIPNMSDKDQAPTTFQPKLRISDFNDTEENICKKIAYSLGVSTSSIFSNIADSRGNITAREISSEDSNTALYVVNKRKLILPAINDLVRAILLFYSKAEDVKITFANAGASNRFVTTEIVKAQKDAKIISEYQAVKEIHAEWNDEQVKNEIDEIHKADNTVSKDSNATQ
jgi:hypothetical protein